MRPIPHTEEPKLYTEIVPSKEAFVELKDGEHFDIKMQYHLQGMKYGIEECYMRKKVFEMLKKAQDNLPEGYKLRIWDAWRPFELQQELYDTYSEMLIKELNLYGKPFDEQQQVISNYVSLPVKDKFLPPLHTTGGAIDLTLIDEEGNELNMGTEFDEFTEKTRTDYFEYTGPVHNDIRDNRRILYNAMIDAGFTNLPSEWWHYEYGNRVWAYFVSKPALYEGVFSADEIYGLKG